MGVVTRDGASRSVQGEANLAPLKRLSISNLAIGIPGFVICIYSLFFITDAFISRIVILVFVGLLFVNTLMRFKAARASVFSYIQEKGTRQTSEVYIWIAAYNHPMIFGFLSMLLFEFAVFGDVPLFFVSRNLDLVFIFGYLLFLAIMMFRMVLTINQASISHKNP